MVEKFVAIAPKGREFVFNKNTMIGVPKRSAERIKNALNNNKYKIKEGETWHVYDNDYYYNRFISEQIKRVSKRDGKLNMKLCAYYN